MKAGWLYRLLLRLIFPFFCLFHPVRAVGRENIPQGPAVICPNHSALSDPFLVCYAFGLRHMLQPMAKMSVLRIPVIGRLLAAVGVIGVERGKSDMKAAKAALRCLKDGGKLMVFPEGTRVKDGKEVEAKGGAAFFACRADAVIVPVYVPERKKWFWPTTVVIGQPIVPRYEGRKATAEDLEEITRLTMRRIYALGGKEP